MAPQIISNRYISLSKLQGLLSSKVGGDYIIDVSMSPYQRMARNVNNSYLGEIRSL